MATLAHAPRLCDVSPGLYAIDRACAALRTALRGLGYSPVRISEIVAFAHDEEHLGGAVDAGLLEPEDLDAATTAFVEGWPEVDPRSVLWRNPDTWACDPAPSIQDALEYALFTGEFDPLDAPLIAPADLEPDDEDWDELAHHFAMADACQWPNDFDRYEEPELSEARVLLRQLA